VAVGIGVAVGTGVAVGVTLGLGVGVALDVAVGVGVGVGDGCLLREGSELAVGSKLGGTDPLMRGDALVFGIGFAPKPDGPEIPDPPPAHAVRKSAAHASAEKIRIAIVLGSADTSACPSPHAQLRPPTHGLQND
jgi:hypothetical protein